MISFKILTTESKESLLREISDSTPGADIVFASDNMTLLLEDEDETEYAVTHAHGCLLIRIFDGEYCFIYPLSLCDGADTLRAADEIRAYAVKEEIPLVYIDVPKGALGGLLPMFRHANIDSADPKNRFFTVRVMSEAALLDEMPGYVGFFGVAVSPLTPEDDEIYARLCKDADTNKFWGYDYSLDEPDPADSYFRESAEREFYRGVAICLAVRVNGVFAGEAILYGFDLMGGCECAVRLLPAFRRKGYATETLRVLKTLAKRIGLIYLCATVAKENKASVRLSEKCLPEVERDGEVIKYKGKL